MLIPAQAKNDGYVYSQVEVIATKDYINAPGDTCAFYIKAGDGEICEGFNSYSASELGDKVVETRRECSVGPGLTVVCIIKK